MPRLQVSLILLVTGLAGFLVSFSLLRSGVPWMWLRFPLAILVAYCVFLLLLGLWLWLHRRGHEPGFDLPVPDFVPDVAYSHGESFQFGGGGDFDGGGAGGTWGESVSTSQSISGDSTAASGLSLDVDLEEGWAIVIVIVALAGGLIACFYIIYVAPALLAEILVDGALVAGLYKRVKRIEQRHWLRAAVRVTLLPAVLVAVFFTIAGYGLQKAAPEAHTIGEAWNQIMRPA